MIRLPMLAVALVVAVPASSPVKAGHSGAEAALARSLVVPAQRFTLPNGLAVVVHTDRKAPIVAVTVAYRVGSADEMPGKTGLAHLFEHLMFNGSENAPGDYTARLRAMGALAQNANTSFDNTIFYQTVPTGALERTLFLESDRMGHLLAALTPAMLERQRGIVENEKREREAAPYGMAQQWIRTGVLGADHPDAHSEQGSFADVDSISLADARDWFRMHYGPDKAVLVLAGDVDVARAHALASRYFGAIPRGPTSPVRRHPPPHAIPGTSLVMHDRVADVSVSLSWALPPRSNADLVPLEVAASILNDPQGTMATTLVDREHLATSVAVSAGTYADGGVFTIGATLAPGVNRAQLLTRIDTLVAGFLRDGPAAGAIARIARREIGWHAQSLESVAGKAQILADGMMVAGDPDNTRQRLLAIAALSPMQVRDAARRWLIRPAHTLVIESGERASEPVAPAPRRVTVSPAPLPAGVARAMPPLGPPARVRFPKVERARLSDGIAIVYAYRDASPMTTLAIRFDAGQAAADPAAPLVQSMLLTLMREGAGGVTGAAMIDRRERLAMRFDTTIEPDRTELRIALPGRNLAAGAGLLAAMVRRPDLSDAAVARVKASTAHTIRQTLSGAQGIADSRLPELMFGSQSPYATVATSPAAAMSVSPAQIDEFRRAWFRPGKATIFMVSDRPLAEVRAILQAALRGWRAEGLPGRKLSSSPVEARPPTILLIDRPGPDPSLIVGYQASRVTLRDELLPLGVAFRVLASDFDSRINTELRQVRHWSYGAGGGLEAGLGASAFRVRTTVQADRTGDALSAMRGLVSAFLTDSPITDAELARVRAATLAALPGRFESSDAVLSAMAQDELAGRPDDYPSTIAGRYRTLTTAAVRAATGEALKADAMRWLVIGDARTVEPQLRATGLPVVVERDATASADLAALRIPGGDGR